MKRKSKQIPKDEMLLAEALAGVNDNACKWARGSVCREVDGQCYVCVIGALALSRGVAIKDDHQPAYRLANRLGVGQAWEGNDELADTWDDQPERAGESLGYAFREAMTNE